MVCDRCIMIVKNEFLKLGLKLSNIKLGEVELDQTELTPAMLNSIDERLNSFGFERIDDRKSRMIEAIKTLIINHIHYQEAHMRSNWSHLISDELHLEYNYLSNLFSSVEGITIEQFIIKQKIEKIKELLIYDELTLGEIAWKLGYSSVSHLSNQFKRVTGMAPGKFKKLRTLDRNSLDKL